ncbi:MAG: hypothetical protein ALECFALPRED_001080, partial [Alectoria fallacina]
PDVRYENEKKNNPALRGLTLVVAAFLLEWLRFIRIIIWHNSGFGNLRKIRRHLEDYEPRYDPTVIPIADSSARSYSRDVPHLSSGTSILEDIGNKKYYSVVDYNALYLSGELTPTAVVTAILPLIRRDISPPGDHSIAWWDSRVDLVLAAAEASTLRYKNKRPIGILDGVPTGIKDEYDVDGYRTCLGSKNDYTPEAAQGQSTTSWCVKKLQEAGAINLGKLSMNEFGLDTSGNNHIYGTPPNPFNPRYYTGGSSSGCGYAVSTGLIPIALGGDGGGSIRIPASFCSAYGLKPSHGRLSHKPGVNHSNTCAVNAALAADIISLSAFYRVIGAPDTACSTSSLFPPLSSFPPSPTESSNGKILGIPEAWFARSTPAIQRLCRSLLDLLVSTYNYTLVPISIPFLPEGQSAHAMTVLSDAATALPSTHNLTPANKILIALGTVTPSTDYVLAQKLRQLLMQHLSHLWKQHPGMIIVTPTTPCPGWRIGRPEVDLKSGISDGDTTQATMEYAWMANFLGVPALSVPVGFVGAEGENGAGEEADEGGIPVGLMGMGQWTGEEGLLEWGAHAETVGADRRRRPGIWVDIIERARVEMQAVGD